MSKSGISFASLLGITFIILRLTNVIDWSWWWVLAPLWIPIAMFIVALGMFALLSWVEKRV